MATFTWNAFKGTTPAWEEITTETIVFSGDVATIGTPITVGQWNTGVHLGDGDPGADQCGANHMPCVEYVDATQFSLDGGADTELTDANLPANDCTLQILFTDGSSVAITNARFYCFDSTTTTTEATGLEAQGYERGVTETEHWTEINNDSGSVGGDNAGERLDLVDQSAATDHTYYIAVSATPETVGAKGDFDFGIALTYS